MKNLLLTFAMVMLISSGLVAQNYVANQSTGTTSPYEYNTNGTTVLGIPSQDVLSSWQSIPFSFDFYGSAVTGYYVSDNGYITFDNGASSSDPNNTSIPNAGGPNNAIYAFWDDVNVISGSGSPDEVVSWTYGTTPNRVHVIQWYSVTPASGSGFVYMAVRLYECGDFDIIHNFGNASGMSATVGCENATGTMAEEISGSPNMSYPSVGSGGGDDVVYTFYWDGINYDASIASTDFTGGNVTIGNNNVTGTIVNGGSNAITSYDLHYTVNGGSPVTANITGQNIAAFGGTASFSHPTVWNVPSGGQSYTLCVWADNINGNADQRTCNDQICEDLFSRLGVTSDKHVIIEEFTGAWCGWCPDGAVVLEDILTTNPTTTHGISVHDGDDMEFNDGIRSAFNVTAYPNGQIDRYLFDGESKVPHSRGAWVANTNDRLNAFTPVFVNVGSSYNSGTREVNATVRADFSDYEAGDLRFVLAVVENNVTGSGSGYDQVNYLNNTSGHPYYQAGDPIVGFVHEHVLRMLPGGAMGNSGVIASTTAPNDQYTEDFTFTLPAQYDENEVYLVGMVYKYDADVLKGEVLNSNEAPLGTPLATIKPAPGMEMEVAPNPVNELGSVRINLPSTGYARVEMFSVMGNRIAVIKEGTFAAGEHNVSFNATDLANGVYIMSVTTEEGRMTKKVVVTK